MVLCVEELVTSHSKQCTVSRRGSWKPKIDNEGRRNYAINRKAEGRKKGRKERKETLLNVEGGLKD